MAKKGRGKGDEPEAPLDLASRIGARAAPEAAAPPPPPPPPAEPALPPRLDGPVPPRRAEGRPTVIGAEEPYVPPPRIAPVAPPEAEVEESRRAAIPSPRGAPGVGEMDIVATPLPTLDDWHRFELALRKVRGIGQVRTEYYRHGVLKVRVSYEGERLAHALREGIPGYRVRVIGEDHATIQILLSSGGDERRPG